MEQWTKEGLSRILDFEVPDDLIQYIQSIESEGDFNEYMKTLLDFDNNQHKNFFIELCKRKFPGRGNSLPKQQKKKIAKSKNQQQDFTSSDTPSPQAVPSEPDTKSKKKTKFVNLYSQEGKNAQVAMIKGRHRCDCQASKHNLINNCLQCGRIVCSQEGSGPCLFCGNLVCTPQEQKEINGKTKASAKLMESLLERSRPEGWEDALLHRNRLLEYDRTSERRTRVTDDDSDYFNANSVWLTAGEKQKLSSYQQSLHDKKHASRRDKKMTFDFAGRQIVEDNSIEHEVDEDVIRDISRGSASGRAARPAPAPPGLLAGGGAGRDVAPGVNAPLLQFDTSVTSATTSYAHVSAPAGPVSAPSGHVSAPSGPLSRVQDPQLQEMSDAGRCLSMHQPWASLLVDGIKLHEGRTWYSSHRGRLWIASTAKAPDPELVRALEHRYRVLYPDANLKFPSFYPAGCLLGCVTVGDCLPQEEYAKMYPGGESDSPYVFICSDPVSLRLRFPITGQHKIYSLDKTIHHAALKCIQNMSKIASAEVKAG